MRSTYVRGLGSVVSLAFVLMHCGCSEYPGQEPARKDGAVPVMTGTPAAQVFPNPATTGDLFEMRDSSPTSETYDHVAESRLVAVKDQPLSTFSIDTDTASYSNIRRFLQHRQLPPPDAVRIEECLNYFTYDYEPPTGDAPFSVHAEVAGCPWNPAHRLARIGIQGRKIARHQRPGANLVFLLDVSGSMNHPKKLPLLQQSLRLLVGQLGENDHIAIVVYAGAAGVVLPSTSATRQAEISNAINRLRAEGSTNGSLGIRLAYDIAVENFLENGINRVILCTDGDFNVGITDRGQLTQLIQSQAKSGVFLNVLGFGMGNLKDGTMESLADQGNGNYAYIDSVSEATKVLIDQLSGTLVTIAKDVKIQVEFNPAQVAAYRLIGYDNRRLADRDFKDDSRDAGEIGAGHSVTALYEIVPAGTSLSAVRGLPVEPLKYQVNKAIPIDSSERPVLADEITASATSDELLTVKLRYKPPAGDVSQELQFALSDRGTPFAQSSSDFRFASCVTMFALLLKDSPWRGEASFDLLLELADTALGSDPNGYRVEFFDLARLARGLHSERPRHDQLGD